jgi:glyoxylase-like metal-dependent hydrolase (beta-lactamase superfamily II)
MALPHNHCWRLELGAVNAYLVDDGDLTLVDAGMPWHLDRVEGYLAAGGYDASDVDRVLLTHFDLDHVGTLAALDLDCPVYARRPDAEILAGTRQPPPTNHKGLFQRAMLTLIDLPDLPVRTVSDGEEVGEFVAYATPGHTPGHTSFVHREYGLALVGDIVDGRDGKLTPSPWPICYDAAQNRESIRRFADHTRDVTAVAMGHGDPVRREGGEKFRALADTMSVPSNEQAVTPGW